MGTEALDQLAHHQRREVHDRRGLAIVTALDPVDTLDRRCVERIAGEAVEAISGEDGDATVGDHPLQGGPGRIRAVRLDRDNLAHRRPQTTRGMPARSARVSTVAKPASKSSSLTAGAWPAPTSSARRGAAVA